MLFSLRSASIVLSILLAGSPLIAVPTPQWRFGSGPLMRSVQNETDAAIARAQTWLIGEQAEDGSWGSRDIRLTAVCALAVSGEGAVVPERHAQAVARASAWLAEHPVTNPVCSAELASAAWRGIALLVFGRTSASQQTDNGFSPLWARSSGTVSNALAELIIAEACLAYGHPRPDVGIRDSDNAAEAFIRASHNQAPRQTVLKFAKDLAEGWEGDAVRLWREEQAQRAWWLARSVNRRLHGELPLTPGLSIDWRRELAAYWVNSQVITPRGVGFWCSEIVGQVEETAYAVLLLREL